jgi:glycosyltransferase involved in cell wall biosynthesis
MSPESSPIRRVAFLSPCWPPEKIPSGIATYIQNVAEGLVDLGVESDILSIGEVDAGEADTRVTDLSPYLKQQVTVWNRVLRRVQGRRSHAEEYPRRVGHAASASLRSSKPEARPQLLEVEESFGFARWIQSPGIPVITRLHGPWFINGPCYGAQADDDFEAKCDAEFRAAEHSAGLSAPSDSVLKLFRQRLRRDDMPTAVIANPAPQVPERMRWKCGTSISNQVLYVGRFDRLKGSDILLTAFTRLLEWIPDAELLFVGPDRGFVDEQGKAWNFDDYVARNLPQPAAARVRFLGRLPQDRIKELRQQCRVAVVTSRHENFPLAVLESLCAGTPTIAPNVGGIPEMVDSGRNGLLFQSGDAEQLALHLRRVMQDDLLSQKLSEGALLSSLDYTPARIARQSLAFYEQVLAHYRERRATAR